jgi:hypothetical protein
MSVYIHLQLLFSIPCPETCSYVSVHPTGRPQQGTQCCHTSLTKQYYRIHKVKKWYCTTHNLSWLVYIQLTFLYINHTLWQLRQATHIPQCKTYTQISQCLALEMEIKSNNKGYNSRLEVLAKWISTPLACCGLWAAVTNCHLGFSLASSVSGCGWVCVGLGLYAILVFPRFSIAVKCAVAGLLIATRVWLALRVYVCMHPGKWLCG